MTGRTGITSLFDIWALSGGSWRAPLLADTTGWGVSFSQTLTVILWIGLGILTISLLVLMQTRWGQARPLSKCVVLSVFAHILFFAYAYGTRLIFDAPAPRQDEVIRLAFVAQESNAVNTPREKQPWEQYPAEFAITPDLVSPTQQDVQVETESPPMATQLPDFAVAVREAPIPNPVTETSVPAPPTPSAELLQPAEPTAIEVVRNEPPTETQPGTQPLPDLPRAEPLDRIATEPLPQPPADTTAIAEAPSSFPDSATLQRLTEVDFSKDTAEARPSANDMTAAADNQGTDSRRDDGGLADVGPLSTNPQTSPAPLTSNNGDAPTARRLGDGEPLPEVYQLRMSRNRMALIEQQGGSEQTEQAVEAALKWLATHQSPDGRWDASQFGGGRETNVLGHDRKGAGLEADTGITGLALLAFLSAGHTHFEGDYRRNVQHGLEFLLGQLAADGNLAGPAEMFARMYCHGMATLAISEAYAMTGDHRMRPYVERAVQYSIDSQDPGGGGWRYQAADRGDMSQFGWQVMALKSAELAGITIPGETRAGMIRFMRSCSKGEHGGLASYRPMDRPSETMTAEALACRYFLGIHQDERAVAEATDFLGQQLPRGGQANLYYWYYGTIALFQAQSVPESPGQQAIYEIWSQWNQALQQRLLARQERVGDNAGSFAPDTVWGAYGGRVYSTAMATLCLEVYYRYLPVYEPGPSAAAAIRNVPQYRVLR